MEEQHFHFCRICLSPPSNKEFVELFNLNSRRLEIFLTICGIDITCDIYKRSVLVCKECWVKVEQAFEVREQARRNEETHFASERGGINLNSTECEFAAILAGFSNRNEIKNKNVCCDLCQKEFSDKMSITKHFIQNHGLQPQPKFKLNGATYFSCSDCGKTFKSLVGKNYHEKNKICEGKEVKVPTKEIRVRSTKQKLVVSENSFKCQDCGCGFPTQLILKNHVESKICESLKKKDSNDNSQAESSVKSFCQDCGKTFINLHELFNHISNSNECVAKIAENLEQGTVISPRTVNETLLLDEPGCSRRTRSAHYNSQVCKDIETVGIKEETSSETVKALQDKSAQMNSMGNEFKKKAAKSIVATSSGKKKKPRLA